MFDFWIVHFLAGEPGEPHYKHPKFDFDEEVNVDQSMKVSFLEFLKTNLHSCSQIVCFLPPPHLAHNMRIGTVYAVHMYLFIKSRSLIYSVGQYDRVM